jgi:hypothetical protein
MAILGSRNPVGFPKEHRLSRHPTRGSRGYLIRGISTMFYPCHAPTGPKHMDGKDLASLGRRLEFSEGTCPSVLFVVGFASHPV